MALKKFVEKTQNQNITFFVQQIFFPPWKSCRLWDNFGNYDTVRQATGGNI